MVGAGASKVNPRFVLHGPPTAITLERCHPQGSVSVDAGAAMETPPPQILHCHPHPFPGQCVACCAFCAWPLSAPIAPITTCPPGTELLVSSPGPEGRVWWGGGLVMDG